MSFEVFICYKEISGSEFAEGLRDALKESKISAFVAKCDIPKEFKFTEKWWLCRNQAIHDCETFLMIVTWGFESSPEIIEELELARKYEKKFMIFRWKKLKHDIKINLGTGVLNLKEYQQIPFSSLGELVRNFFDNYPKLNQNTTEEASLQLPSDSPPKEKPSPVVNYQITQTIGNTNLKRSLPDVGFVIRSWNAYPLRAWIKARVLLGDKDLGHIKGSKRMGKYLGYYDGVTAWNLNPYIQFFGHFSIPKECVESDESLTIEVSVVLEDLDGHKFEYLPVGWTYMRDLNDWFYEPTGDC
ncbi:toll/interleukin-1 receptor domain-containing protein [Candidatus Bathyarchaeota archaeon]|nr:toll/interleukin-1 receptor domain-containing protein [Candidatus Bathyarchaeota archaeon]